MVVVSAIFRMGFVGKALTASARLRFVLPRELGNLETLGIGALPAVRLLHSLHDHASASQLKGDGSFSAAPIGGVTQKEPFQAASQPRNHWAILAACLSSFGVGTLLGAEWNRRSNGAHFSGQAWQAGSTWPLYFPTSLINPSWPHLARVSTSPYTTAVPLPLNIPQAPLLSGLPSLVPANIDFSKGQHLASSQASKPPLQEDSQADLRLSPTSVPAHLPEYLKSHDEAKPLPSPAGSDPTSSTRPYLSANFIADAAAKASPAVVNITVSSGRGWLMSQSAGSGFIIDEDGTILTNAHVVAEVTGADRGAYRGKILVMMQDGRTFEGKVRSFDTLADIAVVKIESPAPLPSVKLGESANLRAGDWVVALGSPFHLMNTVTCGIVSCTQRKSSELGVLGGRTNYIQTDAAINQGNSGGPLVDLDGKVIGINTMKALSADGVSFAIPIDAARKVVEQLAKHGRVLRPYVGVKMLELNAAVISQLKERDPSFPNVSAGVLVPQVIPGSPAEKGGLMPGDIIVEFDGRSISTVREILDALGDRIGESIKVVVRRPRGNNATLSIITEEGSPPA